MNITLAFALTAEQSKALDAAAIGTIALWALGCSVFTGFIGAFIGSFKNRKSLGLLLGMVLGPIG